MKKRNKSIILYSIAGIFSLTFLLIVIKFFLLKDLFQILWICYITIFLIIIGLFKKNSNLILSQVIILAIPDLFWIFDFFWFIFSGHTLIGLVNYFQGQSFLEKIVSLQHLYTVPLSLVALSLMKVKKNYNVLLISLSEVFIIFLFTFFFLADKIGDINCIHLTCVKIVNLNSFPQYLPWFIFIFGFVILSYFVITHLRFINNKKK